MAVYKAKDRVIVNVNTIRKPEYYTATVTSVRRNGIYLTYDDGVTDICVVGVKVGIIGLCSKKLRRKTMIPPDKIKEWVVKPTVTKEAPKQKETQVKPTVQKTVPEKVQEITKKVADKPITDWEVGDIVAFDRNGKWVTAILVSVSGNKLTVIPTFKGIPKIDITYNKLSGDEANVIKVSNFVSTPCSKKDLKPRTMNLLTFFHTKTAILREEKSTLHSLITAMWYYINNKVFNERLPDIPQIIMDSTHHLANGGDSIAYFGYRRGTASSANSKLSFLTKYMRSNNLIFSVLAHEMVHQYQYETLGATVFEAVDSHGETFTKWISPLKSIINVNLSKTADDNFYKSFREATKGEKVDKYYLVGYEAHNKVYGFAKFDSRIAAENAPYTLETPYGEASLMGILELDTSTGIHKIDSKTPNTLNDVKPQFKPYLITFLQDSLNIEFNKIFSESKRN